MAHLLTPAKLLVFMLVACASCYPSSKSIEITDGNSGSHLARQKRSITNIGPEAMYVTNDEVYLQEGLTHHIPCPSLREGERLCAVFWYKYVELGYKKEQLVARFAAVRRWGTNCTSSEHYGMSRTHGLVIYGVEPDDQRRYWCMVATSTGTNRKEKVTVTAVLGSHFPISVDGPVLNKTVFPNRGQRHEIQCPLVSAQTVYTVYWSLDVGKANYTSAIGARYSNGETMTVSGYRENYSVSDNGTLAINSVEGSTHRYWCHRFQDEPGISSAYIDVVGIVYAEQEFPDISGCKHGHTCSVTLDGTEENTVLNCSVPNAYPKVDLYWSVSRCDLEGQPPSFPTKSYTVYNSTAETFDQYTVLNLRSSASCNCTFQCVASGVAIANSSTSKTVEVTCQAPSETTVQIPTSRPVSTESVVLWPVFVVPVIVFVICLVVYLVVSSNKTKARREETESPDDNSSDNTDGTEPTADTDL